MAKKEERFEVTFRGGSQLKDEGVPPTPFRRGGGGGSLFFLWMWGSSTLPLLSKRKKKK